MYRASSPVTACPRCQRALEERAVGPGVILACVACGGVWLDVEQSKMVFERRRDEEALVQGSEDVAYFSQARRPRIEGAAICPIGGEEMVLCEAEGIRIDRCAEHGTWFDAHELRRIVDAADEPSVLDVAVETALKRSTQFLTRVLWGEQKLP
jgi:Zn-finger nucleic acid-binding protein